MKQPDYFLEIVHKFSYSDIVFDMVGKPSKSYQNVIEETSKKLNKFHYHGQLKNDAVLTMIQDSSITVSTSSLIIRDDSSEGFPNVFIESWKFGVPVISDDMIEKIKYLFENPELYKTISANCINLFKKQFSIERNVDLMLDYVTSNTNK